MKISIITPSYNQGIFIEETIQSVAKQTYKNYEHIIVDGKSTDQTHTILRKYEEKGLLTWLKYKDKNQTEAINYGIKHATGDILCYLNTDDLLVENCLHIVSKIFTENPNSMWATGGGVYIDEKSKNINRYIKMYKDIFRFFSSYNLLGIHDYVVQPSTFWRKEISDEIGDFDEELMYAMDYDYWLRIYKVYKPYIVRHTLSKFRMHNNSKTISNLNKSFEESNRVVRKNQTKLIALINRINNIFLLRSYLLLNAHK